MSTKPDTDTGWSKEFPQISGWYWMRNFRQYRPLPVEVNGNSFGMMYGNGALFFARDAEGAEFLGPFSPSDFEQLIRLRKVAEQALTAMSYPRHKDTATLMVKIAEEIESKTPEGWQSFTAPHLRRAAEGIRIAANALREALAHTGEQS